MKMHRFSLALVALSLVAGASTAEALDFTLRQMNVASEGMSMSSSYITDGDNKIMLRIPNSWKASDSPAALDLVPDQAGSSVNITQVKTKDLLPLDAGSKQNLLKEVTAQIPGGAKKVEALPEVTDLLPIYKWTSVEFAHRYEFFGQTVRRGVLFVNMQPGRVVRVTITAPDKDFDNIHEQTRVMMYHWFEPKRELAPEMARQYEEGKPFGT